MTSATARRRFIVSRAEAWISGRRSASAGSLPDGDGAGASSTSVLIGSLNWRFLRTRRRPPMLTMRVMTRRTTARASRVLRSSVPGCDSPKLSTMTDPSVSPGFSSENGCVMRVGSR